MSKITIKFKNPELQERINIFPKIKITSLLKSNKQSLTNFGKGILNEVYRSEFEANIKGNKFVILGTNIGQANTMHLGTPESLNLVDKNHNHYIAEILPTQDGQALLGLIDTKVPVHPGTKKIDEVHLPDYIKGQMRYVGSVEPLLEGEPIPVGEFFDVGSDFISHVGTFVITTTEGFVKFDPDNKPFINYDNEMYTEEIIYLPAGSMIVFIERKNNINYYAVVRRDVTAAAYDMYGMIQLSDLLDTYPTPRRENLSNTKTPKNIITEEILSKLGFEITKTDTELIFETYESLD